MRALFAVCTTLGLLMPVAPVGADARVTATVVLIPADGTSRADVTRVASAIRSGLRAVRDVDHVDATDLLSAEDVPPAVVTALDEIAAVRTLVRSGRGARARKRADDALEMLESHATVVKRVDLLDAKMLTALCACDAGDMEACESGMRAVVTVREDFAYDTERYPAKHLDTFVRVQTGLLEQGLRGTLEVSTEPAGAEVFIDGRSVGPSPQVIPALLEGKHYVTVKALGFAKRVEPVQVRADSVEQVTVLLPSSQRALLLENDLPRVETELGEPRAGKAIAGLAAYLYAQQVILGTVRRRHAGEMEVGLFLYDLRTKFLLKAVEATLDDDRVAAQGRALAEELYADVDRSGAVAAPESPEVAEDAAFYERWWFWTAVGVVAVSGAVAVGFAVSGDEGEKVPEGWTRVSGTLR